MRIPLVIGIGLAISQQITGINIILYYAPEIFKNTGLDAQSAIDDTVIVEAVNLLFTLVAIWVVDRVGRKPLLLLASAGMGLSLAMLGRAFVQEDFAGRAVWFWVLACYGVSLLFPYMLDTLAGKTFYLYAAMCVAALLFVAGFVPETKGRTLEEIERGWRRGSAGPAQGVS